MSYKHLMLVEGKDDQHVIGYLLDHHDIKCLPAKHIPVCNDNTIIIKESGGIDPLLAALSIFLDDGDLYCIAIVLDADTCTRKRWDDVCKTLEESGDVELPENPDPKGTIATLEQAGRKLIVGIWIMPDNQASGILEDFIQCLIPENDDLWKQALESVGNIHTDKRRFPDVRKSKAEIHTWLAWQNEPGKSLGTAVAAKYLDPQAKQSRQFVQWVNRTFNIC